MKIKSFLIFFCFLSTQAFAQEADLSSFEYRLLNSPWSYSASTSLEVRCNSMAEAVRQMATMRDYSFLSPDDVIQQEVNMWARSRAHELIIRHYVNKIYKQPDKPHYFFYQEIKNNCENYRAIMNR